MTYTVAITRSGQITLPKALRAVLGVEAGDKVTLQRTKNNEVTVSRAKDVYEVLAELDAERTPEQNALIQAKAGQTVREAKDEWAESEEGKKYLEEKYGA